MDEKKIEFIVFCLENYKSGLPQVSGKKIIAFFHQYGLLEYLLENYDLLHTLGHKQLIEEINTYLRKRGASC